MTQCAASRSGHDGVPVSTALGCLMIYEVDTDLLGPPMLGVLVCEFFSLPRPGRLQARFSCCSLWTRRLRNVQRCRAQAGLLLGGHSDAAAGLGMTRTLSKGAWHQHPVSCASCATACAGHCLRGVPSPGVS